MQCSCVPLLQVQAVPRARQSCGAAVALQGAPSPLLPPGGRQEVGQGPVPPAWVQLSWLLVLLLVLATVARGRLQRSPWHVQQAHRRPVAGLLVVYPGTAKQGEARVLQPYPVVVSAGRFHCLCWKRALAAA